MSRPTDSEEAFIARYLAPLAAGYLGAFDLMDDAALVSLTAAEELVVTTDAVAAGVHFFPDDAPEDIAWKALAVNVSDLAGKGATPRAYQMALSFPEPPEAQWMERFAAGLAAAQRAFGLSLSGGDTDRRPGPLTVTVTAMGIVPTGRMVRRATAAAGDALYVTGTLGDAALGLFVRANDPKAEAWPLSAGQREYLRNRYLRPAPQTALTPPLLEFASAAMDISDGLLKDLTRLARASAVSAEVSIGALPLSAPARTLLAHDPALIASVVAGGDDYELLVAVPETLSRDFEVAARAVGVAITRIGQLGEGAGVRIEDDQGRPLSFARTGWDHLAGR